MFRRASIPLPLEGFGLELLEAQADRCGLPVPRFMERAAERYIAEPDRAAPSRRVPTFLAEGGLRVGRRTVGIELGPDLWDALDQEAEAQGVALELLVAHAAMLLAADLNP
jgi:hypothetical protein